MKPRYAIITDDPGWHGARLREALFERGCEAVCLSLSQGRLETLPGRPSVVFPGFETEPPSGVFVRGINGGSLEQLILRLDLLHGFELDGIKVYNPPRAIEQSVDKGMTSVLLARSGIPTPPAWITSDPAEARAIVRAELLRGYWMVSKPLFGSQGDGVERHTDLDSLEALQPAGDVYYLQRYVGQSPAWDWRVFVIAGKAVAGMVRRGMDWRTNVAQGGRPELARLDKPLMKLAEDSAQALRLDYAGVDIIRDAEDRYWVLEVNAIPAWKGLQSVAGLDMTRLLVEDFLTRCQPLRRTG
ncbi:MAG: RimK family alpha-L-glutamate ligase [Methylohalobius crimeensis]